MYANPRTLVLLTMTTAALLSAGCSEVATLGADADLNFDGSGNGEHSETADCGDEAKITGSGSVTDGQVTVTVTDGGDDGVFTQTYDGDFDLEAKTVTGNSGTWRILAERGGDDLAGDEFNGEYSFGLRC